MPKPNLLRNRGFRVANPQQGFGLRQARRRSHEAAAFESKPSDPSSNAVCDRTKTRVWESHRGYGIVAYPVHRGARPEADRGSIRAGHPSGASGRPRRPGRLPDRHHAVDETANAAVAEVNTRPRTRTASSTLSRPAQAAQPCGHRVGSDGLSGQEQGLVQLAARLRGQDVGELQAFNNLRGPGLRFRREVKKMQEQPAQQQQALAPKLPSGPL